MTAYRRWIWRLGLAALAAASMTTSAALIAGRIGGGHDATSAAVPSWLVPLGDIPDETAQVYVDAAAHRDLFAHLPCYCGCSLLKPSHASLERCFIRPDGSAEPHATGCRICADIARDALAMDREGRAHAEIRARIDATYADAGTPTDTALP